MIPQYQPQIKFRYAYDVFKQVMSGWVGTGKVTEEFESKIGDIMGSEYVVSTTSGTTAIMMSIKALKLPEGSTILFPAYTFLAGANAARFLGYKVELVDIKRDTLCMDPNKVIITDNISAIIFVNHNGYIGDDVNMIKAICIDSEIPMIEDSSQCIGIRGAGIVGDVGILSFSVPKLVTTGQGGAVITNDKLIYKRLKRVRDHGDNWRQKREHNHIGINLKFNDILASYGLAQLRQIDKLLEKRKLIWKWYNDYIGDTLNSLSPINSWMITLQTNESDKIIKSLAKHNIKAEEFYKPINWNYPYTDGLLYEVAESVYKEMVYLPSSLTLKKKNIKKICHIIKNKRELL